MESLPDNVVTKIATYLHTRDLLSCSAVCKKWREKLNTDSVWTPRLTFSEEYYTIQGKYKDMILCPPYFTSLQPLCAARECYIRDQCLHFNFRAGLFTAESFRPKADGKVNQVVNHLDKDGHYWLFLTFAHVIEVWNITNKPFFQTCAVKKLPIAVDNLYVLDTKVLLVYNNFVQIFSFENPKYELILQCCFFVDQESPPMDVQGLLKANFNQPQSKHVIVGNILIGYPGLVNKAMLPSARLHVWNMDTLVKLEAVKIVYEPLSQCYDEDEELENKNWVAFQIYKGDNKKMAFISNEVTGSSVTIFDLEELKFLDFFKPYNKAQIFWSKIVEERIHLIATLQKVTFFATTIDFHGGDGVVKNLTKTTGINYSCQFSTTDSGVYVKTPSDLWLIGDNEGRLTSNKLLDNFEHNKVANSVVAGHFLFSKSDDGPIKMWDLDHKWQIRELPITLGGISIPHIVNLPNVDFPPKVIFLNTEGNLVCILSFCFLFRPKSNRVVKWSLLVSLFICIPLPVLTVFKGRSIS